MILVITLSMAAGVKVIFLYINSHSIQSPLYIHTSTPFLFFLATWMKFFSLYSYFLNYILLLSRTVASIFSSWNSWEPFPVLELDCCGIKQLWASSRCLPTEGSFCHLWGTGAQFILSSHFWDLRRQGFHPLYGAWGAPALTQPAGCLLIFYQDFHEVRVLAGYFNESRNMYHR